MYDIIELNGKKVAELREIATKLEINRVEKLKKQDLVYAILDEQALRPQPSNDKKKSPKSKPKSKPTSMANKGDGEDLGEKKEKRFSKNSNVKNSDSKSGESMRDRRDRRRKESESKENTDFAKNDGDFKDGSNKRDNKRRDDRGDRSDRGDRNERGDRINRNERGDRNDRNRNRHRRDKHDRFLSEPEEHGYNFDNLVEVEGVLEVQQEGYGILRSADYNYLNSPDDVYVTPKQMKEFSIQNGDTIVAGIRPPRKGEKFYPLISVKSVNGRSLDWIRDRVPFKYLTPLFPTRKI